MNNEPIKLYKSLLDLAIPEQNEISRAFFEKKLNKKPKKSKYMIFEDNFVWQADLMYLRPNRSLFQYLLVCVDASTRRCDAEPMRDRTGANTVEALRKILNRHIIATDPQTFPKVIVTDPGAEFQREFTDFCNLNGIKHRTTQPGRKQQTSIVEHVNGLISYAINTNAYRQMTTPKSEEVKNLLAINVLAGNILPQTVAKINEFVSQKYPKPAKQWFDFDFDIETQDIRVGDLVHVVNPQTKRLRHRYGTHRFLSEPFQVMRIFRPLIARQPFRYLTTFSDKMTFTRDEIVRARDFQNRSHQLQFD